MQTQHVYLSEVGFRLGDYEISLNYVGYGSPAAWNITPHKHSNYELHIVSEGELFLSIIDGESEHEYRLGAGSVYLTGPGITHSQRSELMEEYAIRFDIEYREGAEHSEREVEKEDNILVRRLVDKPFLCLGDKAEVYKEGIGQMLAEAHMQLSGYKKKVEGIFSSIIIDLCRGAAGISGNDNDPPFCIHIGAIDLKARLDTYFFACENLVPPEQMMSELHITRRDLSRLMQKYYKMTYTERSNELRIECARKLLLEGVPVNEVWQRVGYNSAQYFTRVFREKLGQSPGEYKRSFEQS